jgi:hypothetical protein
METATQMRRHGDVLILTSKGFKIPAGAKLRAGKLLHKGTNNSHVISKGIAAIGELDGKKYLRVKSAATVSHVGGSATHASKPLPVGDYWVEIQNFYDHLAEEAKKVID